MNLLVLRLATINAEEQVAERLEAAEAAKQLVHLEGDVINPNNGRQFINQEKPEQLEQISVCSCACLDYKIFHTKRSRLSKNSKKSNSSNQNHNDSKILSIFRKSGPVKRLILGSKSKKGTLNNGNTSAFSNNKENNNEYEMNSTNNLFNRKISNENSYNMNDSGLNKKNTLMNSNTNIKRNSV